MCVCVCACCVCVCVGKRRAFKFMVVSTTTVSTYGEILIWAARVQIFHMGYLYKNIRKKVNYLLLTQGYSHLSGMEMMSLLKSCRQSPDEFLPCQRSFGGGIWSGSPSSHDSIT